MNAKVEAMELINSFTLYLGTDVTGEEYYTSELEARRCADIAVDKILDFIRYNVAPYTYDKDSMEAVESNLEHYTKVKKEIASYGKGM